jgi:flagellar motor component MotA
MDAMRQSWTDDRLDDLSHRMNERFDHFEAEMNRRFERVEGEMREIRTEMREDNRAIQTNLDSLQKLAIRVGGAILAASLGMLAALIGLIATQL